MAVRMSKPWRELTAEAVAALPGQLGVYQLAEPDGTILRIGYAGGRSLFGLTGELKRELEARQGAPTLFRVEVNMQYLTRYEELLMVHLADHGSLPPGNPAEARRRLGRISPGGAAG